MFSKEFPWLGCNSGHEVACIVPHQDDESVFVSVLRRYPQALVVHVTDGGPMDPKEWKGMPTREAYVTMRRQEANAALDAALHTGTRLAFEFVDGTAAQHLEDITQKLYTVLKQHRTSVVYCLAYEGGHPDHDAVACAVHTATARLPKPAQIIEAPAYRMEHGQKELVWQRFVPFPRVEEVTLELTSEECDIKSRMFAAHVSQRGIFSHLSKRREFFREAPSYDFLQPANGGNLSPYFARVGISNTTWCALAKAVLASIKNNYEV